tara:strand:- start:1278 stop:2225 length:948 start_codon:yes stop_codon:yes gene_type:complete
MLKNSKPIVLVAGDPKSVFLEIFFKSLKIKKFKNPLILIVNKKILLNQMKKLKYNFRINQLNIRRITFKNLNNKKINFIDVPINKKLITAYINKSFDLALSLIKKDKKINLINGPINKKKVLKQKFLGITEYLDFKTKSKGNIAMLIYNKELAVSPITTHLPLKNVHKHISKIKIINHVKLISEFYKKKLKINPKIGITGLNPHCESNFYQSEEDKIIKPAIKYLSKKKFKVTGPFPADTIFMKDNLKKFDVIIGMYHDQVLTPIKSIYGFNAINITLGLPFVRVSPDHGPNERMFLKNKSNPTSLLEAINFLDK